MDLAQLIARIEAQVPTLSGRTRETEDFQALLRQASLTAATGGAFVMPAGLRGGKAEISVGSYVQDVDEVIAVVILVPAPSKGLGRQGATITTLIKAVIEAVAGWAPDEATGVFQVLRGAMINLGTALLAYQLEFSISDQVRTTP
ncbi:MAG: hypothetical protein AB7S99_10275 [Pseudodonghicola sp.]